MTHCPECGSDIGPALNACPVCGWLVHGQRLKELSASARLAAAEGRLIDALAQWREVLELLPAESRQYDIVQKEAAALSTRIATTPSAQLKPAQLKPVASKVTGPVGFFGAVAVVLLKFKALFFALAAEAKLLVLGLGKGATLASMLVSLGVYQTALDWKLALGLVLGIYVHEMGHVWMMRRFGMRMQAPLFVPGLGAFVVLKQRPLNRVEDARIGIAGPIWGTAVVVLCFGVARLLHSDYFARLTHFLAWITIFNLIPVWQLDGSRTFQGMNATGRGMVLVLAAGGWLLLHDGLLGFLALMAFLRMNEMEMVEKIDRPSFSAYVVILCISVALVAVTPALR